MRTGLLDGVIREGEDIDNVPDDPARGRWPPHPLLTSNMSRAIFDVGLFRYEYTLHNQSDPLIDAGSDAYDLTLFFSVLNSLTSSATPVDWDLIAGAGFLDTFLLQPGANPAEADGGPGQSLGGFDFVFDGQVGRG